MSDRQMGKVESTLGLAAALATAWLMYDAFPPTEPPRVAIRIVAAERVAGCAELPNAWRAGNHRLTFSDNYQLWRCPDGVKLTQRANDARGEPGNGPHIIEGSQ